LHPVVDKKEGTFGYIAKSVDLIVDDAVLAGSLKSAESRYQAVR